jgi:hypothetical protein
MAKAVDPAEIRFAKLAVDVAALAAMHGSLHVLLIPVHLPPIFVHVRGLPGGLVRPREMRATSSREAGSKAARSSSSRPLAASSGTRGVASSRSPTSSWCQSPSRAAMRWAPQCGARSLKSTGLPVITTRS